MTTYRTRPQRDFTSIRNSALRDERISLKAKGLLAMMLTFPPDWTYRQSHLEKLSTDGRDALRGAVQELEACGYIRRHQTRSEDGRVGAADYVVDDVPSVDGFSGDGKTDDGLSGDGKPATTKTEGTKTEGYEDLDYQPPPTPPRQGEAEAEVQRANRTPPRNSDKVQVLRQRYKTTWEALGQLSSDRGWKPNQFKAVAVTMLDLARWHGEQQATAALRDVLVQGDQIRNPVKWVEKALTDDQPREGPKKTKRLNLLEGTGVEP